MTYIDEELEKATKKLAKTEWKLSQIDDYQSIVPSPKKSLRDRLLDLTSEVCSLELAKDLSEWNAENSETLSLVHDAKQCIALGMILSKHEAQHDSTLYVYEHEYQPLHRYVRAQLLLNLRQCLRRIKYPSKEASEVLAHEVIEFSDDAPSVSSFVAFLTRLQIEHEKLQAHMTRSPVPSRKLESVVELCRPIVERVTFHFLQESENRLSSNRIDRLPEWVLNYIRENALEGGPWDFIADIASSLKIDELMFQFLNEMCQLSTFVITQRNFFRHEKIVGPRSTPILLSAAIEQLFSFDAYVRDLVVLDVYPTSLSQLLVAEDEDLWTWFLNNESEWAMSTLFDTELSVEIAPRRISPRAELFTALIHSIQSKVVFFLTPGPYISHVGVPLCQSFLDAIHQTSTELRGLMGQRKLMSVRDMENNLESWLDLINGTHMAAIRLNQGSLHHKADHDLARVGRSMDRLRDALVDEYSTTLVENVIMERAKLASYLMRCSHILSLHEPQEDGLSPDLQETATVFSTMIRVCSDEPSPEDHDEFKSITSFAPMAIRSNVTELLGDKFLEVILDAHGMTPDISPIGAQSFLDDIVALFGSPPLPSLVMRLIDVTRFAAMEQKPFLEMRMALSGLVQPTPTSDPLHYESFEQDGTLLDEALSMIRAKGFSWMDLEDAISILNRRERLNLS